MQDCSEAKKPCKGILKSSSSFDRPGASYRKSAKFDELNVLQTYHPVDKDYGHMKIDEPKTPYNYVEPDVEHNDQLDANLLAEKLRIAADTQTPSFGDDDASDEEFAETEDEKVRRLEFERRRKAHYNEFEAVRLARKLIEEELGDGDDDDDEIELEKSLKSEYSSSKGQQAEEQVSEEQEETPTIAKPKAQRSPTSAGTSNSGIARPMEVDHHFDASHPCTGRE